MRELTLTETEEINGGLGPLGFVVWAIRLSLISTQVH